MAGKIIVGNAILCDYVGRGENNKHILLNVYSGDVLVSEYPLNIILGLYIEYGIQGAAGGIVDFEIRSGADTVAEVRAEYAGTDDIQYAVFVLQQFPLRLAGDATVEVWIRAEGCRAARALRKRIRRVSRTLVTGAPQAPAPP